MAFLELSKTISRVGDVIILLYKNPNDTVQNYKIFEDVKMWQYSGPTDSWYVDRIKDAIYSGKFEPGMIYIAEIGGEYYCYDGNSRLEAIEETSYDGEFIINLTVGASNTDIANKFEAINTRRNQTGYNMSSSRQNDLLTIKKVEITIAVDMLTALFTDHVVGSKFPRGNNFNPENVIENITKIFTKHICLFGIDKIHAIDIFENIMDSNTIAKNYGKNLADRKGTGFSFESDNCYVFGNDKYLDHLEKSLFLHEK